MKRRVRTKDGIEAFMEVPDCRHYIRMCDDGAERTYRMEVAYPSREPFFVEECERPRLVSPGDPAELEKERDKLRRELDNLDRNSDCVQRDLMAKLRYTEDHRNVLSDRVAFLQRELERLKPKKRGL